MGELSSESVQIRPIRRADFSAWEKLWSAYNAFYGRVGPMHALVAESAAGIVGLAHFLYHRSTTQIQPTCYLSDLFTVDAVRGQGVGGALIHAVYERAKLAGSPRVYWQTHETNAVARRLYDHVAERSGFIVDRHSV